MKEKSFKTVLYFHKTVLLNLRYFPFCCSSSTWFCESGTLTVWAALVQSGVWCLQSLGSDAADSVVRSLMLSSHWSILSHEASDWLQSGDAAEFNVSVCRRPCALLFMIKSINHSNWQMGRALQEQSTLQILFSPDPERVSVIHLG